MVHFSVDLKTRCIPTVRLLRWPKLGLVKTHGPLAPPKTKIWFPCRAAPWPLLFDFSAPLFVQTLSCKDLANRVHAREHLQSCTVTVATIKTVRGALTLNSATLSISYVGLVLSLPPMIRTDSGRDTVAYKHTLKQTFWKKVFEKVFWRILHYP